MSDTSGKTGQGPFNFGPSPFDLSQIFGATAQNDQAITNRYNQLGLGGSTMEGQDLAQQGLLGEAAQGQAQTQEVGNPAFNTALQTPQNTTAQTLGDLASAGKAAGSVASLGSAT